MTMQLNTRLHQCAQNLQDQKLLANLSEEMLWQKQVLVQHLFQKPVKPLVLCEMVLFFIFQTGSVECRISFKLFESGFV
jgi:hypothetical protein